MVDVQIDTTARIERIRMEDQAASPASPDAGYSQLYTRQTGTSQGLYIENASGAEVGPFIDAPTSVYASKPLASQSGNLFLPSDGFTIERDTGVTWMPWGPVFPLTSPPSSGWAWVNQGTATITNEKGGLYLEENTPTASNLRIYVRSIPSVPYTISTLFLAKMSEEAFIEVGLIFRQSSDGKMSRFVMKNNNKVAHLAVDKWTNETTYSADYKGTNFFDFSKIRFMRIADDNSNRICSYSHDGQHWYDYHTVGRTDFLTADQVGIHVRAVDTGEAGLNLIHWLEE